MFFEILKFELLYRFKRPATYLYFLILFLMSFLFITTDVVQIGGGTGNVFRNSPFVLSQIVAVLTFFGSMICSGIMGVPIFRDFDHRIHEIYYSTTLKKMPYWLGRFVGSYIVAVWVFSGMLFGTWFGTLMPWVDAATLSGFSLQTYLRPLQMFILPNVFFMGAVFFVVGALSRNLLVIYMQGVLFLVLYVISNTITSDIDNKYVAALIDVTGLGAFGEVTRYWTPAEKNVLLLPFEGVMLQNRLLISLLGVVVLGVGYYLFEFSSSPKVWSLLGRKNKKMQAQGINTEEEFKNVFVPVKVPFTLPAFSLKTYFQQFLSILRFETKLIFKSPIFIAILTFGIFNLCTNLIFGTKTMYDTALYPATMAIIGLINNTFQLFLLIIIAFYVGELVWRERSNKIAQIADALPISNYVLFLGKFVAMLLVVALIYLLLIGIGVVFQTFKGYTHYEFGLYLQYFFGVKYIEVALWIFLAFFIHVLANNKFMGHAIFIITIFIVPIFLSQNGYTDNLYVYGGSPSFVVSAMNGFGHWLAPFRWFMGYWYAFASILLIFSALLWVRGTETAFGERLKLAFSRFNLKNKVAFAAAVLAFVGFGSFVYKNTHLINEYHNEDYYDKQLIEYEQLYKKYQKTLQPKITDVFNEVDIFPENRAAKIKGYYLLQNKNKQAVDTLFLNLNDYKHLKNKTLQFSKPTTVIKEDEALGVLLLKLNNSLSPNDTLKLNYNYEIVHEGFENERGSTDLVQNGTFFNSMLLPVIGYQPNTELQDPDKRRKYKLPKQQRMPSLYDTTAIKDNFITNYADFINFEAIVSTSPNQIAIAPGYLQKEWTKDNRRYFHYKMDSPIMNFYAFLSANYQVKKQQWQNPQNPTQAPVNIEIYYHKGHEYNLDTMINSIKNSITYYSNNFAPYQHQQARILEFPRYASFAQSFPNTIPYSEGIGFIANLNAPDAIDYVYYVTAHEIAHQWWGHQIVPAEVQGGAFLSETMSQYSALMVMKQKYGEAKMRKFLQYELDKYLQGRSGDKNPEQPLLTVENQQHIYYQKGSVVMYALQDYLGETTVNKAVGDFLKQYRFKNAPYPTTLQFYDYLQKNTPDSLQYFIEDGIKKITLYNNKCTEATYTQLPDSTYQVNITATVQKFYADSIGNETATTALNNWVDVGITNAKNEIIQRKRVKVTHPNTPITAQFISKELPAKAGIDPLCLLIDRDTDDNLMPLSQKK